MIENSYKIFPLGLDALTVELDNEISESLNLKVLSLADYFEKNKFDGFIETVPAYASLTLFFDLKAVRKSFPTFPNAFAAVKNIAENALTKAKTQPKRQSKVIEIPVNFGEEFAIDLEFVADTNRLSKTEVIEIFLAKTYRVFMLGFLPGFAYMGEIDERIAAPRKQTPRTKVAAGSVGIADRQTGIYPFDSPGGWQIIGKTDVQLFSPHSDRPTFLKAGDVVRFIPIK